MDELRVETVDGNLTPEDTAIMTDGMLKYHAAAGHPRHTTTLSITLKNQNGRLFGCVSVAFLWNGMEIKSLWIDESIRHQGWGRTLMTKVEDEAKKRGCTLSYTNTFSWQAPEFYKKLGYTLYGKLDDFPKNNTLYYFSKTLK